MRDKRHKSRSPGTWTTQSVRAASSPSAGLIAFLPITNSSWVRPRKPTCGLELISSPWILQLPHSGDSTRPSPVTQTSSDFATQNFLKIRLGGDDVTQWCFKQWPPPLAFVEMAEVINMLNHVKTAKEIQWNGVFSDTLFPQLVIRNNEQTFKQAI